MYGTLAHAKATLELGFHLFDDDTTLNLEYRSRKIELINHQLDYPPIVVSTMWFHRIDWLQLFSAALLEYPEATDDVRRLGEALTYLSMYEMGVSEMMTLLNIRQGQAAIAERKALTDRPLAYLTNLSGVSKPASWSAETVLRTTWA